MIFLEERRKIKEKISLKILIIRVVGSSECERRRFKRN